MLFPACFAEQLFLILRCDHMKMEALDAALVKAYALARKKMNPLHRAASALRRGIIK